MESGVGIGGLEIGSLENKFEKFFRTYYYKKILKTVHGYPETKSLLVDFDDLDKFDITLTDELIKNPDATIIAAESALRNIQLPLETPEARINVRFTNPPPTHKILIRDLRSEDVGKFIAMEGIVRKTTDVRPKLVMGAFECPYCGHVTYKEQDGEKLKEPFVCDSCEKKALFNLVVSNSTFVDSQKILIQESLEDLRGGEHPKQIAVYLEDDLTGQITPGNRIEIAGILRATRKTTGTPRSRVFEIFIEGNSYKPVELDFEEVEISKEDEEEIKKLAKDPMIYEKIRDSIAPHIYGYGDIKEAIMYQLFSSQPIRQADGSRARGDSHIILIGEPATGKCIAGDTTLCLANGNLIEIKELINSAFEKNLIYETDDGRVYSELKEPLFVLSMNDSLKIESRKVTYVWKRKYKGRILKIMTQSGKSIKVTPEHPFFVVRDGQVTSIPADELAAGERIATPRIIPVASRPQNLNVSITPGATNAIHISIPKQSSPELMRFIGYLIAEGSLDARNRGRKSVRFSNRNTMLTEDFIFISHRLFGISPHEYEKEVKLTSVEVAEFLEALGGGILSDSSKRKLPDFVFRCSDDEVSHLLRAFFDGEGYVSNKQSCIDACSASRYLLEQVQYLLLRFGILSTLKPIWKCATNTEERKKKKYYRLTVYGNENLTKFAERICFLSEEKKERLLRWIGISETHTNTDTIPNIGALLRATRRASGLTKRDLGLVTSANFRRYEIEKRYPSRKKLSDAVETVREALLCDGGASNASASVQVLERLASSDIFWDEVVDIQIERSDEYVYDLTVEGCHNFIANGIIIHNSALLQYVARNLAPRGIYASGKGTSTAGLTASAVKDEFGEGSWTLEAGALVLADLGIAAVDEFEKMEETDRAAMHEAMELQQVSIAKAGMLATFRARCSILAAANPKYGRFDKYKAISEQVNLSPTILSRFDLIFFVEDVLADTKEVAKHILNTVVSPEIATPKILPGLLKKYIAYARQNIAPALSEEARKRIEQFYVDMREAAKNAEDVPIPLTARQLWAIIRLARASARVRLSEETTLEDAERAIRLVRVSLEQAGFDMEAGRVDIDKIMVGVTKSQRDRINEIIHIIRELEAEFGHAKKHEIIQRCEAKGISERNAEELLDKLRRDGSIYEPKQGIYKVV